MQFTCNIAAIDPLKNLEFTCVFPRSIVPRCRKFRNKKLQNCIFKGFLVKAFAGIYSCLLMGLTRKKQPEILKKVQNNNYQWFIQISVMLNLFQHDILQQCFDRLIAFFGLNTFFRQRYVLQLFPHITFFMFCIPKLFRLNHFFKPSKIIKWRI